MGRSFDRATLWRLAMKAKPVPFRGVCDPRTIGSFELGRAMCDGIFRTSGYQAKIRNDTLWTMRRQNAAVTQDLHSFLWLDHLAAVSDARARFLAELWTTQWIKKHAKGAGPGWSPAVTGRRVARWINHSDFLTAAARSTFQEDFLKALNTQVHFLARSWRKAPMGLARLEAVFGLVSALLVLEDMDIPLDPAMDGFVQTLTALVDDEGAVESRNPEDLLHVLLMSSWALNDLEAANVTGGAAVQSIATKVATQLRGLRHGDGSLPRFHGASRGQPGQLDAALLTVTSKSKSPREDPMGFQRLVSGSTTVLMDAAPPFVGKQAAFSHLSANAFEMYSGRVPIIVNVGSGIQFGTDFFESSREAAAHSNLVIDHKDFGRFDKNRSGRTVLLNAPKETPIRRTRAIDGTRLQAAHDGYLADYGVRHARTLDLTIDGKGLRGEDLLAAQSKSELKVLKKALQETAGGLKAKVHFHLHPDVRATLNRKEGKVSLDLPNGVTWTFAQNGKAALALEPSLYFQQWASEPRDTQQIVLTFPVKKPVSKVTWSLVKSS